MNTTKSIIGSIISGTMREVDLIPAFFDALLELNPDKAKAIDDNPENKVIWDWLENPDENDMPEDAVWLLDELFGWLDECALPYFYFGAHPGDGADFGFWLCEDVQQQVKDNGGMVVGDWEDVPADFDGEVLYVSDHGNATLCCRDAGGSIWNEIWSVV